MPLTARAQAAGKVPRVGVLTVLPLSSMAFTREFPGALRDLGYVEGRNIVLDWRSADGSRGRLADLAAELVRLKADVLVTVNNEDTFAAKRATTTIPIIMVAGHDPVGAGLIASLARPGGNISGRAWFGPETSGKMLQILKETVSTTTRVLFIGGPGAEASSVVRGMRASALPLGLTLHVIEFPSTDDVAPLLDEVDRWKPDALFLGSSMRVGHRDAILNFAVQRRLPTMTNTRGLVSAGALMAYIPNSLDATRSVAYCVDRILKGASPADLPVTLPQRLDLIINLKTAKAIGLTIPPSILLRADDLIE
jgi:putative ABC transport system substrate-binding protein